MNKYIGVTIGPIFETINMAGTPAALWAASYMFSFISKTVCETLVEKGVPQKDIITPYYKKGDPLISKNDGIGLFNDRIIFRSGKFDIADFSAVRKTALEKTGQMLEVDVEYLTEYIMISAAEFEAENPIAESGRVLDCLELATPYVFSEKSNPLMTLFVGETGTAIGRNKAIKRITAEFEKFQLRKTETTFKNIEAIANAGTGKKKFKYYAIVRSDGDNTNKIIKNLGADTQRAFSKDCLSHCARMAQLVEEFDGVTIYSGGDDLLAILPCESHSGETLFEFTRCANEMYIENFRKYNVESTLSFGIAVAYYKSPLEDVLAESAGLLFDIAKSKKNGVALGVRKHSGQTDSIFVSNDCIDKIQFLYNEVEKPVKENEVPVFFSAATEIAKKRGIFKQCTAKQSIINLFFNELPSNRNDFWHKHVPEMYADLQSGLEIKAIGENGIIEDDPIQALVYLLRIISFFTEKEVTVR